MTGGKTFASLQYYNYRLFFLGGLASNTGTWMGRVAQDWLVLTQLTAHDATALGIVTALQFAPVVLLAPLAGAITDRFAKRRILIGTQVGLAVTSLLLAVLVIGGWATLWQVYVIALLQGAVTALDNPSRQAFVSEMVPPERLSNAVGLNATSFNSARLIGPGIAGLLIAAIGTGWTLAINTVSFAAVVLALMAMRVRELTPSPRAKGRGGVREGLAYVRRRPDIQLIMFIVFMLGTFGMNFQITIALMATTVYGKGAQEYGALGSVMAVGSLAAALLAARRARPRLRVMLAALAGFTVAATAAAIAPTYLTFAIALVPCGLFAITALNTANATVQLSVSPVMRGRVMALYMAIFMGGTPVGAPLVGWIGGTFGARWTIAIGAIAVGAALVGAMVYLMRVNEVEVHIERSPRPHLEVSAHTRELVGVQQ
ncbi:MFS transporter [Branchiibius cervicis]|uniref:MFS transporter n=1 Tax=Branchiibius cervicis TaxID=908252 RepID=A0ABW2AWG4_9MICO